MLSQFPPPYPQHHLGCPQLHKKNISIPAIATLSLPDSVCSGHAKAEGPHMCAP